jgi:Zn-dependent oligopeptidase
MNKEVGKAYRDSVLRPGGSKDGMDLLIDFLGRKPDTAPFLKSLGFEQPAKSTL